MRVLFHYHACPWPSQSGVQRRVWELLGGFRDLGCELTLLGGDQLTPPGAWTDEARHALAQHGVGQVRVFEPTAAERLRTRALRKAYFTLGRNGPPLDSVAWVSRRMRDWFAREVARDEPAVVVVVYATLAGLMEGLPPSPPGPTRVIEAIDLSTLNWSMWRALEPFLPRPGAPAATIAAEALDEDFFGRRRLQVDPKEYAIYNRCDFTLAISQSEAEAIGRHAPATKACYLPMTCEPVPVENTYAGPALLTTGPNPFSLQGCFYFAQKVLPAICRAAPDFRWLITGSSCKSILPSANMELAGFVPDLRPVYREARFFPCPIFGGTGQLVKVVEAMAHGLPVIVMAGSEGRTPVIDGVNGFIVPDAEAFAARSVELWQDNTLCRRLGEAARETIQRDYSGKRLREGLSQLLARR